MSENNEKAKVSKFTNLESNVAATLAYIVAPVTGIFFFLIEKEDKFVRFHAFQSILFGVGAFVVSTIASSFAAMLPFLGFVFRQLVSMALFGVYLFLMWKAYNKETYELPYLGKIAKDQSDK